MFTREIDLYLTYSIPLSTSDRGFWLAVAPIILGGAVLIACVPSARASDRYGRKPLIYLACAVGGLGSAIMVVAPIVPVALGGAVLIGLAAGTFLAVDWALMTDIIPKAATGRYMGLSNVATGLAGTVAVASAGLIVLLFTSGLGDEGTALRLAFVLAVALFGLGSFFLRRVDPTRREDPAGASA
jgi:MFS family permease